MNGNGLPPGQGGRGRGQYHNPYQQQPPLYNGGYGQHQYYSGYNGGYYPQYGSNAPMHNQNFYPYTNQYQPGYPQRVAPNQTWAGHYPPAAFHSPVTTATPPAQSQQLNPTAQFIPGAAQPPRPVLVSSQPSPVVSSSAYHQSPSFVPAQVSSRPGSQVSSRPSPPRPLPQITQPLYTEPEAEPDPDPQPDPEPQSEDPDEPPQRTEIYVAPLPFFPPRSRVPWPVKYTREKKQHAPGEGYFVLVEDPSRVSRKGGELRKLLDVFTITHEAPDAVSTPSTSAKKLEENNSNPGGSPSEAQSGSNADNVQNEDEKEPGPAAPKAEPEPAKQADVEPQLQEPSQSIKDNEIKESLLPDDTTKPASQDSKTEPQQEPSHTTIRRGGDSDPDNLKSSDATAGAVETTPIAEKSAPLGDRPWTALFKPKGASGSTQKSTSQPSSPAVTPSASRRSSTKSLAETMSSFQPDQHEVFFLEPRGLVNRGNMCYMNAVLQVLVFCIPFYDLLDQVGKRSNHSFKTETPLLQAMILFMREFNVIAAAEKVEQLRTTLKEDDLVRYGGPFSPDMVYEPLKKLRGFSSMVGGGQQDAEEFLGILLDELQDECAHVMQQSTSVKPVSPASASGSANEDSGWKMAGGRKQKTVVTRSSGKAEFNTPIRKIFGGKTRSELRVGNKEQNPTEQELRALQLDIGSPQINNIVDALKAFSAPETVDDFDPSGKKTAVKQNFIETFPEVLIIHLKRFDYNNGTQKIWKKIEYPLELEIPKEVLPRHKLNVLGNRGLPKYCLIAVVYHHGNNATNGHYTVDVRRQEGQEWIRLDDTFIRRIASEDVAEGGSGEDPKKAPKAGTPTDQNPFSGIDTNEEEDDDTESKEWQKVNGSSNANGSSKTPPLKANGTSTPKSGKSKTEKSSAKDNKVAYLLFYQKM